LEKLSPSFEIVTVKVEARCEVAMWLHTLLQQWFSTPSLNCSGLRTTLCFFLHMPLHLDTIYTCHGLPIKALEHDVEGLPNPSPVAAIAAEDASLGHLQSCGTIVPICRDILQVLFDIHGKSVRVSPTKLFSRAIKKEALTSWCLHK
jgi:hypothetical protein